MTAPAPCPDWPVVYPGDCPALEADPDNALLYEQMAATYLWNWTGRSYGLCPVIVRPCRSDCDSFDTFWGNGPFSAGYAAQKSRGFAWGPALINGQWYNLGCGRCGDDCSCSGSAPALRLPGPVASIDEVRIDGAVLDPAVYRVDNATLLVRLDGQGWPTCQDLSTGIDQEGSFAVSYQRGSEVPVGGQVAAGVLACELAKAAGGDASCQLPRRLQTIARQGVTMTFLDAMDDLDKGRTGIWVIDSWVASVTNPPRPSRVYSVDIPHPSPRITTWPVTP